MLNNNIILAGWGKGAEGPGAGGRGQLAEPLPEKRSFASWPGSAGYGARSGQGKRPIRPEYAASFSSIDAQVVLGAPALVEFLALDFQTNAPIGSAVGCGDRRFAMQQPADPADFADGEAA